jgi:two-component system sensor histidine kinase ChvG
VLNNLVDNARSFSAHGGNVRLALRRAKNTGRNGQVQDGIEIVVDDDGPGIPAYAFERIFERFYTDRPNQGFGQNSGLGLSISRQIIEAYGGKIWALNRLESTGSRASVAVTGDDRQLFDAENEECEGEVVGARFVVWLPTRRSP